MSRLLLTFSGLFPSLTFPSHGLFVYERMRRVAEVTGVEWRVIAPTPLVPRLFRRGRYRIHAQVPETEVHRSVTISHPRYFHLPGVSLRHQASRIAKAALPLVERLTTKRRCVLDAHYVYPYGIAAVMIANRLRIPCIVTARGSDIHVAARNKSVADQIRRWAPRAQSLLAVSDTLKHRFASVADLPQERVEVVRNGVDLDLFQPGQQAAAREKSNLPQEANLVLAVGRLVSGKRFCRVAQALHALPPEIQLVVVGEGPERSRIERSAPSDRLHMLGARTPEELAWIYRACDLMVLPSASEGWPNVVTEALASGIPVVATPVGSVPRLLPTPAYGTLLSDDPSPEELAVKIQEILRADLDRTEIRSFAKRFSWQEPVSRIIDLLDSAFASTN